MPPLRHANYAKKHGASTISFASHYTICHLASDRSQSQTYCTNSQIVSVGSTCVGLHFDFCSVPPQFYYLVSAIALFSLTGANSYRPCEPERTPLVVYLHEV
jgi:hypothetical protein